MRCSNVSLLSRLTLASAAIACVITTPILAQNFAPAAGSTTGKHSRHDSSEPEKFINATVQDGILSLDGQVLKVQLNYTIHKAGYMYFFLPGSGTVVLSLAPMTNATLVKGAFHGSMLKLPIGNHTLELNSKDTLLGNGKPVDAYMYLDTGTKTLDRYTMVGFGMTTQAPYTWPYAAPAAKLDQTYTTAPAIPARLLPRTGPAGTPTTTTASIATAATAGPVQQP